MAETCDRISRSRIDPMALDHSAVSYGHPPLVGIEFVQNRVGRCFVVTEPDRLPGICDLEVFEIWPS
jgi:hypothetical protein